MLCYIITYSLPRSTLTSLTSVRKKIIIKWTANFIILWKLYFPWRTQEMVAILTSQFRTLRLSRIRSNKGNTVQKSLMKCYRRHPFLLEHRIFRIVGSEYFDSSFCLELLFLSLIPAVYLLTFNITDSTKKGNECYWITAFFFLFHLLRKY